jgi:hypothetical protein
MLMTRTTLSEPIVIAQGWKNRSGASIRISLSSWEGHTLIDVRSWHSSSEGKLVPGEGFAASVRHLPRLAAALTKAVVKATELGLITGDAHNDGGAQLNDRHLDTSPFAEPAPSRRHRV